MATTGIFNGDLCFFTKDGNKLGHSTSASMDLTLATADATTKDSAGFSESIPTLISATGSFEAMVDYSDDGTTVEGLDTMAADLLARTEVVCVWGTGDTGDTIYTFNAWVTGVSTSAPNNDTVTYSGSFQSTGTIVASVVA